MEPEDSRKRQLMVNEKGLANPAGPLIFCTPGETRTPDRWLISFNT